MNTAEILTVLVLYEMPLEHSPAYRSLTLAVSGSQRRGRLFVYDNSKLPQSLPDQSSWDISYCHDPTNPGVSRAYNKGAALAKRNQLKWLLLADQDTFFPENIYALYEESIRKYPGCRLFAPRLIDQIGIVSPFRSGMVTGRRIKRNISGRQSLFEIQAVNSGLLVDVETFEAVGGYDERFALDFSDFNFFKRLKGFTSYMVILDATCQHELSSTKKTSLSFALQRFDVYLKGLNIMKQGHRAIVFTCYALLQAIRLSFRYRSGKFISSFLSSDL